MIKVQNIYYMLAYAFQILSEREYRKLASEHFENAADLCAAILIKGVGTQLKRGLGRDYIAVTEPLSSPRGKIDISDSIKGRSFTQKQLICSYDVFSTNIYMNRIIKTTMMRLLNANIEKSRKKEIRKLLVFFSNVDMVDLHSIDWHFRYDRNNQTYHMLIYICYLVVTDLLQNQNADGKSKLMDFGDDHMHHLYEKFILSYYKKEFPQINANASKIEWDIPEGSNRHLLPDMKSDILLTYEDRTLIIDAKYYGHSLLRHYNRLEAYSGNLYQIFTYVKNRESRLADIPHEKVSGMLLYAQTEDEGKIDENYLMSGNPISIKTLDLNSDFSQIKKQLNDIALVYLGAQTA